jgi:TRAP transporter 4TM/12TM fusion protein
MNASTAAAPHDEAAGGDALLQEHEPLAGGFPPGLTGRLLFWLALAFSAFQIATAAHILDLPSQVVRAVHVGFLMALAFPLLAMVRADRPALRVLSWGAAALSIAAAAYQWVEYNALILRAGDPTTADTAVGVALLLLLFVVTWRAMGIALPIISGGFLAYCLFGQYLPSPLNHRGYDFTQVIDHMAFGTEGVYGIPTYVSSSYIFLFILFGAFLEKAGMISLFTDIALGLFGHKRGGPAKVAVVASGLMGTISGSGVANVVTTGQFTIPLMIRFGYRRAFAGGVEATASMGGQIMPPVMGAVAFIMAETLDVPYATVVQAAVVPAVLYFLSAFWMVHLEAGRANLAGLPASELPSPMRALREKWYLILPLAVLVALLFSGYTPLFAGTVGLALTVMLILGGTVALGLPSNTLRIVFWIGLGLVAASFQRFGMPALSAAIVALIAVCVFIRGGRQTLVLCRDSLAEGAKTALPVGLACAIVGIIIGTMTLTGAANTFGQFVVAVGKNSLFLSLLLTMVTCLILGMGIPTIPNYIITSSIAGPALLELGVPLLVSHMFVFYFGILADLTPPVALACFAAAPIARERGLSISIQAIKVAAAGFVIPFMAVYSPALMLQPGGPLAAQWGLAPAAAYIIFKAMLAIGLWGAAVIGFGFSRLSWPERVAAALASATLIAALPLTDEIGFVLAAAVIVWHWRRSRRERAAPVATAAP